MAAFIGIAQTAEVALSAATAKTVLQLVAATNHRVRILGWGVFFDGVSATAEPVQVEVMIQTTAGTMSSLTPVKLDRSISDTLLTTAQHTATAEPTASDVLDTIEVHPQQGYEKQFLPGQEIILVGAGKLGIKCTAPATVNVRAKFIFEE